MTLETDRTPRYKLRIKNIAFSDEDALENGAPHYFDVHSTGWLEMSDKLFKVNNVKTYDPIREKATASFDIEVDDFWMLKSDLVCLPDDDAFLPKDPDNQPVSTGSRLVLQVIDNGDANGTITISGTVGGASDSEVVTINGGGTYVTEKYFTALDNSNFSASGLNIVLGGIFADVGASPVRREVQILVDTNGDGVYGLIFGGYMYLPQRAPVYGTETITLNCVGYKEVPLSTQHLAGYRTPYRCANYTVSGTGVVCSAANENFGVRGKCTVGDYKPMHPNGTVVSSGYYCTDYTADATSPFPYDHYNYREDYAPNTETGYSWYPEDYARAMKSLADFLNSVEEAEVSRPWTLAANAFGFITTAVGTGDTTLYVTGVVNGDLVSAGDYILVDDEWMLVTGWFVTAGSGTINVTRAQLFTSAKTHAQYGTFTAPSIADATLGVTSMTSPPLMKFDIGGTVSQSGELHATTMSQFTNSRECVFYVDHFKQIHLVEMYGDDPGYGDNFEIGLHDVMSVSKLEHSDVVNHVYAYVDTPSGNIFCQMRADEVSGLESSVDKFGWVSHELDASQINCLGNDDLANGKRGFVTAAESFLEKNAFPVRYQTVTMDSFVPGECYWKNPSPDPDWEFSYTDPINKHIDIKGRKVTCVDYHMDSRPSKVWTVEAIRYTGKTMNFLKTDVTMSRLTTVSDFE